MPFQLLAAKASGSEPDIGNSLMEINTVCQKIIQRAKALQL